MWDIIGLHNSLGWQFSLRAYRTLPHDHTFFNLAAIGDVTRLQDMLAAGEASVTDREERYGQTALHVSTEGSDTQQKC